MGQNDMSFIKGNYYAKDELIEMGLQYIKETTITLFYRKGIVLYLFEAKLNKNLQHRYLTYIED